MFKLALAFSAVLLSGQNEVADKRLRNAAEVFEEIMSAPDKAIPQKLLDKAQCIIIVPGMVKAALGIGGTYGRGFVSCRRDGGWGAPAGVRLAGGSFGLQLGAQATDVVMLVMNRRGLQRLLSDKFTIGADAAAVAGPVGRTASADTDVLMNAEIISWSRARGIFAGVSLDGTVVQSDRSEDQKLYGQPVSTRQVVQGNMPVPPAAEVLVSVLDRYAPKRCDGRASLISATRIPRSPPDRGHRSGTWHDDRSSAIARCGAVLNLE